MFFVVVRHGNRLSLVYTKNENESPSFQGGTFFFSATRRIATRKPTAVWVRPYETVFLTSRLVSSASRNRQCGSLPPRKHRPVGEPRYLECTGLKPVVAAAVDSRGVEDNRTRTPSIHFRGLPRQVHGFCCRGVGGRRGSLLPDLVLLHWHRQRRAGRQAGRQRPMI